VRAARGASCRLLGTRYASCELRDAAGAWRVRRHAAYDVITPVAVAGRLYRAGEVMARTLLFTWESRDGSATEGSHPKRGDTQ